MNILITGGAGYIGSHVARIFVNSSYSVVLLDNLQTGHSKQVEEHQLYIGDYGDKSFVKEIITKHSICTVVHLGASLNVRESVEQPELYYDNNVSSSINLIKSCIEQRIPRFVFASSAAVYGDTKSDYLCEGSRTSPVSPYGKSKLIIEWYLKDISEKYDFFNYFAMRFFNVAGASKDKSLGDCNKFSSHLIKVLSHKIISNDGNVDVFGDSYDTYDGTCIRDYIHVEDLASIHLKVVEYLRDKKKSDIINCGYGRGYSVLDIIKSFERVTGSSVNYRICPRREGDVTRLVSNVEKMNTLFSWTALHDHIDTIVRSSLEWEKSLIK